MLLRRDPLLWCLLKLQGAVADALRPEGHIASRLRETHCRAEATLHDRAQQWLYWVEHRLHSRS